jgi:hypothetical protein
MDTNTQAEGEPRMTRMTRMVGNDEGQMSNAEGMTKLEFQICVVRGFPLWCAFVPTCPAVPLCEGGLVSLDSSTEFVGRSFQKNAEEPTKYTMDAKIRKWKTLSFLSCVRGRITRDIADSINVE